MDKGKSSRLSIFITFWEKASFWEKAFSETHGIEGLTTFGTCNFERASFKPPNQLLCSLRQVKDQLTQGWECHEDQNEEGGIVV